MKKFINLLIIVLSAVITVSCLIRDTPSVEFSEESYIVPAAGGELIIPVHSTGVDDVTVKFSDRANWEVDENGDILAKTSPKVEVPLNNENWFEIGDIYYYKEPVAPGDSTINLLVEGGSIVVTTDPKDRSHQVIEVFAEAIQSKPEETVRTSWGVTVSDEKIVSVP